MDERDTGLERLCKVYLNLEDDEKEKVIRLAEGLLDSQKVVSTEKIKLAAENSDLSNCIRALV